MHRLLALTCLLLLLAGAAQSHAAEHKQNRNSSAATSGDADRAGFVFIGNQEYYIGENVLVTWTDANNFCNSLGMRLASLEDSTEDQLVREHLVVTGIDAFNLWTSGVRVAGSWVWAGVGQAFTHAGWGAGQPDSVLNCVCTMLRGAFGWLDTDCSSLQGFICE